MTVVSRFLLSLFTFAYGVLALSTELTDAKWYKPYIGVPNSELPLLRPSFHRLFLPEGKTLAFLLTTTQRNVLAALDPVSGKIAWRHMNDPNDPMVAYGAHEDGVALLSGIGGTTIRMFDIMSGNIVWERQLHDPNSERLLEPQTLGVGLGFGSDSSHDVFVLAGADTISRLNGFNGKTKWSWKASSSTLTQHLESFLSTKSVIYSVGFETKKSRQLILCTAINSETGQELSKREIPINTKNPNVRFVNGTTPILTWTDSGKLHTLSLSEKLSNSKPVIHEALEQIENNPILASKGIFIGHHANHSTSIYRSEGKSAQRIWHFTDSREDQSNSESLYGTGVDKEGRAYVTRIYWSNYFRLCSLELLAPHAGDGKGAVTGQHFTFDTMKHGRILHSVFDVVNPSEMVYVSRFALSTSTGSFQMWQQEALQWNREESLTSITDIALIDLSVSEGDTKSETKLPSSALDLANKVLAIIGDVAGSFLDVAQIIKPASNNTRSAFLELDSKKVILAVTGFGKVFCMDAANGEVLWSLILGFSNASGRAMNLNVKILPAPPSKQRSSKANAFIVVTLMDPSVATEIETHIIHLDLETGVSLGTNAMEGYAVSQYEFKGRFHDAFISQSRPGTVAVLDDSGKLHVYPKESINGVREEIDAHTYITVIKSFGTDRITGRRVSHRLSSSALNAYETRVLWSQSLGYENIDLVVKPSEGPHTMLSKTQTNGTTVYRHVNPDVVAIVASSPGATISEQRCGILLIEGSKGKILHRSPTFIAPFCHPLINLVGNRLTYAYVGSDESKTQRIVAVEIYQKTQSSSSYNLDASDLSVLQQSYIVPFRIISMAPTNTKFGIAYKDLVVASDNHQLQTISNRLLDPRRPTAKPTSQEMEEGLRPFDPLLPQDSNAIISKGEEVLGITRIRTSNTRLESTSLVLASGLDMFQSFTTPSGTFDVLNADFNRFQLVATACGLLVAIVLVKPLTNSKRLKGQWYD